MLTTQTLCKAVQPVMVGAALCCMEQSDGFLMHHGRLSGPFFILDHFMCTAIQ